MAAAPQRVRWRHRAIYLIGRSALFVVNLLPERPAYWLLGSLGRLYFRCSRRRQAHALRLLRNAYGAGAPEAELLRLGREGTANLFKVVLDTVRVIPWLRSGRLRERLDTSAAGGLPAPPFIGVTAHLGSWELAGIGMALERGESHAIARMFKNPLLNEFILSNRRRAGLIIHPKRGGIRPLTRALERGCVGMQVADQHQRLRGVRVPYFGELASTERSAAVLALRRGYPIVVGAVVRVGPGFRFRAIADEPLCVAPSGGDFEADVRRVATEVNHRLERLILSYPEQYLWIHRRYRDNPQEPHGQSAPRPSHPVPEAASQPGDEE